MKTPLGLRPPDVLMRAPQVAGFFSSPYPARACY